METITCILQKRFLEAVKISCDKRMRWGLMITANLVGNTEMDCGVGVAERFGDCLGYLGYDWLSRKVFLGGETVRRHR